MEAQGYGPEENELNQDNKATILLEENGKASSRRTRALDIRYFFLKDHIKRKTISVEYCPTKCMVADYMTKPLQGKLCLLFKDVIMGKCGVSDVFSRQASSVLEETVTTQSLMSHEQSPGARRKPNTDIYASGVQNMNYYAVLGE